jgi:hypothetical protein
LRVPTLFDEYVIIAFDKHMSAPTKPEFGGDKHMKEIAIAGAMGLNHSYVLLHPPFVALLHSPFRISSGNIEMLLSYHCLTGMSDAMV